MGGVRDRSRSNRSTGTVIGVVFGAFVLLSVLLGIYVDSRLHWFTLFGGLNLFQSAFTNWCPMMAILRKGGLRRGSI